MGWEVQGWGCWLGYGELNAFKGDDRMLRRRALDYFVLEAESDRPKPEALKKAVFGRWDTTEL